MELVLGDVLTLETCQTISLTFNLIDSLYSIAKQVYDQPACNALALTERGGRG